METLIKNYRCALMTISYSFIPILMFNTMIFIGLFGYSLVIVLP